MAIPQIPEVRLRSFDDIDGQREDIYQNAISAFSDMRPYENATHRLEVAEVGYDKDYRPTIAEEKAAILGRGSLHRPLKGTLRLVDVNSNQVLDEQRTTLAHIPHLNSRGLFVRKGVIWSLRNQERLRPGVYARKRKDGSAEAQFNVNRGRGFRLELDNRTGLFKINVGQSTTRAYPVLRAMGVTDDQIKDAWGDELFRKNFRAPSGNDTKDLRKLARKFTGHDVDDDLAVDAIKEALAKSELDEETTTATLGRAVKHVDPSVLLDASRKVLRVNRGEADEDVRDSQQFQSIHSAEDFVRDRLKRDQAGALRKLLWKASKEGRLKAGSGLLNKNIDALFDGSGLAAAVEDINPIEIYDQRQAITRMGDGGIHSEQSVSREARGVQPSYLGVIDPVRAPESSRMGLDMRVTDSALKGSDGKLYTRVRDRKGELVPVSAEALARNVVAFPGELGSGKSRVIAVKEGKMTFVRPDEVDYEVPNPQSMFSRATNMIPYAEGIKGQRLLMGGRMSQQALPIAAPEAPLVQTADAEGNSLHVAMGKHLGAFRSDEGGVVTEVTPDHIKLRTPHGVKTIDIYNNYPTARKTVVHSTPAVEVGQTVAPGDLVAKSNFTDDAGTTAIGRNLRAAWVVAKGDTIEDAFVISQSAAEKMAGVNQYRSELKMDNVDSTDKMKYRAIYTDKFTPDQYDKVGEDGVVKLGTIVEEGDPLILGFGKKTKRAVGAVIDSPRSMHSDHTQTWDHEAPGTVTDIVRTKKGIQVAVAAVNPMKASDKLATRFGAKGVVSRVVPDEQMPTGEDGNPMELLVNALGITSRTNPSALAEAALGKVAAATGKVYNVQNFSSPEGVINFAINELEKAGVKPSETLYDPVSGREIPDVFTGMTYVMQLHHSAESKSAARDTAGYTLEGIPAKGGYDGSKRVGGLDVLALLSAGATEFLRDAKLVRGQRNDDYWRAVKTGGTPQIPTKSFANEHFEAQLKGAGVNIRKQGTQQQLAPLLDTDVDEIAAGEITSGKTFDFETMRPIPGGLFDPAITGGADGTRYAKITLPEKVPHPLFMEPIQNVLGVTGKKLEAVLRGEDDLNGKKGPGAIGQALSTLNIDREIERHKTEIRSGRKSKRDKAVKALNYLTGFKNMGIKPDDLLISKVPVMPPKYRPVTSGRGMDIVHDLNYLYNDLIESVNNYKDATEVFGESGDEYLTMMQAVQAVSGLHQPVSETSVEQGVKGILKSAIGVQDTPKAAGFQRKVIGSAVDTVGRGTVTADANLDMDQISIPEEMAWTIFRPYIMRNLVTRGYNATTAKEMVDKHDGVAKKALVAEMERRPVVYNRAPALHQYNYVSGFAKLRDDNAIGLAYPVLTGLNADYDGDNINIHVPSTDAAVKEVQEKLLPSRNLFSSGDFGVRLTPIQDYVSGLFAASTVDSRKEVKEFNSKEDALKAYRQGKIGPRDPIRIKG